MGALHFVPERLFDWAVAAIRGWTRWFWNLRAGPKIVAVAVQVVVLYLLVSWLGLGRTGAEVVQAAAVGLCFFAILSLVFGSARRS
jgi:hypothetical protein